MKKYGIILRKILIVLFWILVWEGAALAVDNVLLFPTPWAVLRALGGLMKTAAFYRITGISLWNVMKGILYALVIGAGLSILTYKLRFLHELVVPLMTVIKATPVASFIVLTLIWIGSAKVPTLITFLIVLPVIWTNLDEGLGKQSPKLLEVARVYNFGRRKTLFLLTVPTVKPYFVSACRTSFGLAWKAGIAAEIIAMPRNSIGTMIGNAKQYLNTEEMFAWTLTVICLSLLIETGFVALLNRFDRRKRKEANAKC